MKRLISSAGVVTFAVLSFLLSYGLSFGFQWLVAVQQFSIDPSSKDLLATGLAVSGPALAGLLMVWFSRDSIKDWISGDLARTRPALWWLGIPVFTITVTLISFGLAGASVTQFPALLNHLPLLMGYFAFNVFVIGLFEELGWRGWLLRRLLVTRAPLTATLIIAPVWLIWHLPKLLSDVGFAVSFAVAAVVNSTILTALWGRFSGRTSLAALAHGSFNAPIYFMAERFPDANSVRAFGFVVATYALVALAMLASDRHWWLRCPAKEHTSSHQTVAT